MGGISISKRSIDRIMNRLEKFLSTNLKSADPATDIDLINKYTVEKLTPEEVFCFSVILCDNDIDRDTERFTDKSLEALAPLFCGKTGISDHRWSSKEQIARIYHCAVEDGGKKNKLGEPLKNLVAKAYMLAKDNQKMIDAINGGIVREVSVGCYMGKCACSICGKEFHWWTGNCRNEDEPHSKGKTYEGKLCYGNLEDAKDAYEFSFVAVPAQPGAGVTKDLKGIEGMVKELSECDLSKVTRENLQALMQNLHKSQMSNEDLEKRNKIMAEMENISY